MKRRKYLIAGLLLLCLLLLAQTVLAMSSANFALNWFTTEGSGGKSSSANYSANVTVGQTGIGSSASSSTSGCVGYWCGAEQGYQVFLPLIMR